MSKLNIKAAVDIGNHAVKAIFGDRRMLVPNLIAEESERRAIIQMNQDPLSELHVRIKTQAIPKGEGIYVVGQLAKDYPQAEQMDVLSEKSKNPQPIILLLTTLALFAAQEAPDNLSTVSVSYSLALGLPIDEIKAGRKQAVIDALKGTVHTIQFLDTPVFGGRTVRLSFSDVFCYAEGHAAYVDLISPDGPGQKEFADAKVAMVDVGSVTTDICVIEPRGRLDNVNSESIKTGVAGALDAIMGRVFKEHNYRLKSRQHLVDIITHPTPGKRNKLPRNGSSIEQIVHEELLLLAKTEFQFIKRLCHRVPDIDFVYLFGGGAILLRSFLDELNDRQFELRFAENAERSVWGNALSYWELLNMAVSVGGK